MAAVKESDFEHERQRPGFSASISDASLADLIQMYCLSGVQRVVRVTCAEEVGYLYFRGGNLVHAMSSSNIGEEAALEILGWPSGRFEPCNAGWPETETIQTSAQGLLLRAAQLSDESGRRSLLPFRRTRQDSGPIARSSRTVEPVPESGSAPSARITAAVRIDPSGTLLSCRGAQGADLASAACLAVRLANLIGDTLCLDRLRGIEATSSKHVTLMVFEPNETLLALRAPADADLGTFRERYGI